MILRQGPKTVRLRFWPLDAEHRYRAHSGETGRDVRADRCRATLARAGDHAAEAATTRLERDPIVIETGRAPRIPA